MGRQAVNTLLYSGFVKSLMKDYEMVAPSTSGSRIHQGRPFHPLPVSVSPMQRVRPTLTARGFQGLEGQMCVYGEFEIA